VQLQAVAQVQHDRQRALRTTPGVSLDREPRGAPERLSRDFHRHDPLEPPIVLLRRQPPGSLALEQDVFPAEHKEAARVATDALGSVGVEERLRLTVAGQVCLDRWLADDDAAL